MKRYFLRFSTLVLISALGVDPSLANAVQAPAPGGPAHASAPDAFRAQALMLTCAEFTAGMDRFANLVAFRDFWKLNGKPSGRNFNRITHRAFTARLQSYALRAWIVFAGAYASIGLSITLYMLTDYQTAGVLLLCLSMAVVIGSLASGLILSLHLLPTAAADLARLGHRRLELEALTADGKTLWSWRKMAARITFDPTAPTIASFSALQDMVNGFTPKELQSLARVYFEEMRHSFGQGEFVAKLGAIRDARRWLSNPTAGELIDLIAGRVKFFGRTGRRLNVLGAGGIWIGRVWEPGNKAYTDPSEAEQGAYFDHAYETLRGPGGVVHIDTSDAYGKMQGRVGRYWARRPETFASSFIATKWGEIYENEETPSRLDFSGKNLFRSLRQSYEELGRVDLLYMHGPRAADLKNGPVMLAQRLIRLFGYLGVHYLGVSISDPEVLQGALYDGSLKTFDILQTSYHVFRNFPGLIRLARAMGIGVALNSAVRKGESREPDAVAQRMRELTGHNDVSSILVGSRNHYLINIGVIFPQGGLEITSPPRHAPLGLPEKLILTPVLLTVLAVVAYALSDTIPALFQAFVMASVLVFPATFTLGLASLSWLSWSKGGKIMSKPHRWRSLVVLRYIALLSAGIAAGVFSRMVGSAGIRLYAVSQMAPGRYRSELLHDIQKSLAVVGAYGAIRLVIMAGERYKALLIRRGRRRRPPPGRGGPMVNMGPGGA